MVDVNRAWKDEHYFNSLSEEQRAALPANPAGLVELTDEHLDPVAGGSYEGPGQRYGDTGRLTGAGWDCSGGAHYEGNCD